MAKFNRKRKLFLVAIIAIGLGVWLWPHGKDAENNKKTQSAKPQIGSIEQTVTAQGKLEAKDYVDVGAQVSGQLKKVHFEIGDIVKKGDLLAEIDPKVYESKVEADEARLNSLRAQLAQSQSQAVFAGQQNDRNARLIKREAISKEALEETNSAYKVAKAGVKALEAQIAEQLSALKGDRANLGYTKIYAPMAGTVTTLITREGQTINANQQAPVIMQIANLDVMTVRAQVAEADVMTLTPDMEVYFTTLGAPDMRWKGKIRQILPTPEVVNDVVLYIALIDVDNKERQLMTGMSTQVFFVKGSAKNVLTIPVTGLGKRMEDKDDASGLAYMVKTKNGEKLVRIGLMDRKVAEVKSGLSEADEVIINAPAAKKEGGKGMRGMGGMPRI